MAVIKLAYEMASRRAWLDCSPVRYADVASRGTRVLHSHRIAPSPGRLCADSVRLIARRANLAIEWAVYSTATATTMRPSRLVLVDRQDRVWLYQCPALHHLARIGATKSPTVNLLQLG